MKLKDLRARYATADSTKQPKSGAEAVSSASVLPSGSGVDREGDPCRWCLKERRFDAEFKVGSVSRVPYTMPDGEATEVFACNSTSRRHWWHDPTREPPSLSLFKEGDECAWCRLEFPKLMNPGILEARWDPFKGTRLIQLSCSQYPRHFTVALRPHDGAVPAKPMPGDPCPKGCRKFGGKSPKPFTLSEIQENGRTYAGCILCLTKWEQ